MGTGYRRVGREPAKDSLSRINSGPCSNYSKETQEVEKQVTHQYGKTVPCCKNLNCIRWDFLVVQGLGSMFPLQAVGVRSLVGELRSCMVHSVAKINKNKNSGYA